MHVNKVIAGKKFSKILRIQIEILPDLSLSFLTGVVKPTFYALKGTVSTKQKSNILGFERETITVKMRSTCRTNFFAKKTKEKSLIQTFFFRALSQQQAVSAVKTDFNVLEEIYFGQKRSYWKFNLAKIIAHSNENVNPSDQVTF